MPSPTVETVESSEDEVEINQSAFLPNQDEADGLNNAGGGGIQGSDFFILPTQYSSSDESEDEGEVQKLTDLTSDSDNPVEKVRAAKRVKRQQDSKRKAENYHNWLKNGASSKSDSSQEENRDYWTHSTAGSNSAPKKNPAVTAGLKKVPPSNSKDPPKKSITLKSAVGSLGLEVKNTGTIVKNHTSRKFKEFTKSQKKMHEELKKQQEDLIRLWTHTRDNSHVLLKLIRGVQSSVNAILKRNCGQVPPQK
ncbi:hypothetical protein SEMRO_3702_G350490.1 [Seminavis robusta]|uniref:Uncharacterized protein n=1 Tax=Seminavis robusta TaxID=568900 RepID=A0A9N8F2P5_9STRA|nr:hypothetical protein SEMRO_3702_G350490.1 [Seminavis robusta]|eukprot:Sro3702_g350490.1 n/a (251) ;mRNA; f:2977-3729